MRQSAIIHDKIFSFLKRATFNKIDKEHKTDYKFQESSLYNYANAMKLQPLKCIFLLELTKGFAYYMHSTKREFSL
jgi:hypothetical protein